MSEQHIQPYICLDIIQIILDFSDIKTQLILTSLSREYYDGLKIRELIYRGITQEIIMQKKFDNLQILDVQDNSEIVNVNHLKNTLITLYCGGCCGIDQNGISDLKRLQILHISNNLKITD